MRQILLNNSGAVVARVPRPIVERGAVLVRVHYSLISVGTEIAPLRSVAGAAPDSSSVERGIEYAALARHYLRASVRDPRKALSRVAKIARSRVDRLRPARTVAVTPAAGAGQIQWTGASPEVTVSDRGGIVSLITDQTPAGYQIMSQAIGIPAGQVPVVRLTGRVEGGAIAVGLLNDARDRWLGSRTYQEGPFEDTLIFEPAGSTAITIVVTTAGAAERSRASFQTVDVGMAPPTIGGLPLSELDVQGWNVGYSAAGEVVAVGSGITDLAIGDAVACAGAGQANHADFITVKRNLVARVPAGCPLSLAASTTVGTIALQGVRRAAPQLGERVCVLGLGLIGQITVQLVRASGCDVIGLDLDAARVERAKALGMEHGASDTGTLLAMVRDLTGGRGVDRTLITAATKSNAVINLAMDVTRAKGTVVIVGDVGLKLEREVFYRKEIDLLMSTSYGPGRYDAAYETEGHDYPFGYVRWTLNRNMQAYLDLVARGRLEIQPLIDRVISVDEAPAAYRALADGGGELPLGVLIRYPDDTRELPEPADATRVVIRGHRKASGELVNYALVGAGAFGTAMLVPQMKKRRDRFFLKAVVSRNAVTGGNFARENQVEVLTSDLEDVLRDPGVDLVVIATRHDVHAEQVVRSLNAGKHVFVEKPLALNWAELERVTEAHHGAGDGRAPLVLVGFNRRFSPALTMVKQLIASRRAPLVIGYRLNAGYIPLDHWVHGPQGGGRNIGEACHMYDVFRYLTAAPAKAISAEAIDPGDRPYRRDDNFSATITYEDGSLAHLLYTSLGAKSGLGKERIEIFCDGETYVVDDFKKLIKASDGSVLWQSAEVDKGHAEELSQFGDAIATGGASPIPFEELTETSAVALHVDDLLYGRTEDA
ncbi:MAG: oxidoreductase domain protein [Acidobacteria bacterium]|nr:oxidoreductase domain protein [Acidobacteriota bacterium]